MGCFMGCSDSQPTRLRAGQGAQLAAGRLRAVAWGRVTAGAVLLASITLAASADAHPLPVDWAARWLTLPSGLVSGLAQQHERLDWSSGVAACFWDAEPAQTDGLGGEAMPTGGEPASLAGSVNSEQQSVNLGAVDLDCADGDNPLLANAVGLCDASTTPAEAAGPPLPPAPTRPPLACDAGSCFPLDVPLAPDLSQLLWGQAPAEVVALAAWNHRGQGSRLASISVGASRPGYYPDVYRPPRRSPPA